MKNQYGAKTEQELIRPFQISKFQTKEEIWDHYSWYKDLRNQKPVFYDHDQKTWNVFLYEDVNYVLSNPKLFSSKRERSMLPIPNLDTKISLIFEDADEHRKRRGLISKAFTPKSLQTWKPKIESIVQEIVDELGTKQEIDIVSDFAIPIPVMVISELLGVPTADRNQIKEWSNILFLPYHSAELDELNRKKAEAIILFQEYLLPIVQEKRKSPQDDIISDLTKVSYNNESLSDSDIVNACIGLLGAGNETTTLLLTNTFYCLLIDQPNLYEELKANPSLIPQAIEEVLRYRFFIALDRKITEDIELFGVEMKAGESIIAWISSANRDENQFPHAEQFDIHRPGNDKHLTFGKGPHFCLGAPLARLEAKIALEAFINKFSNIQLSKEFNINTHMLDYSPTLKSLSIIVETI